MGAHTDKWKPNEPAWPSPTDVAEVTEFVERRVADRRAALGSTGTPAPAPVRTYTVKVMVTSRDPDGLAWVETQMELPMTGEHSEAYALLDVLLAAARPKVLTHVRVVEVTAVPESPFGTFTILKPGEGPVTAEIEELAIREERACNPGRCSDREQEQDDIAHYEREER